MDLSTKQKELQTWLLGGKGRDKIENWDWQIYTTVYKIDN